MSHNQQENKPLRRKRSSKSRKKKKSKDSDKELKIDIVVGDGKMTMPVRASNNEPISFWINWNTNDDNNYYKFRTAVQDKFNSLFANANIPLNFDHFILGFKTQSQGFQPWNEDMVRNIGKKLNNKTEIKTISTAQNVLRVKQGNKGAATPESYVFR